MATEHKCSYILDRHLQFFRNEGAKAGGIEDTRHANHSLTVELRPVLNAACAIAAEWVGNDNQDMALGEAATTLPTTTSDMIL